MRFTEYQERAQRTSNTDMGNKPFNALLGLNGEVGELTDLFKKHWFQGHELDTKEVMEEAGDILWYISELCEGMGIDMGDVATCNIEKLLKRYPEGFDVKKSINRKGEDE